MKQATVLGLLLIALFVLNNCSSENLSALPESSATYEALNAEVGCGSKYSDDKKKDVFESRYKDHWMTWRGEIVLADSDDISLNIDGKGTQDLQVDLADKQAGYNLTKGTFVTVRFLMKTSGGCILPFSGDHATIVR